MIVHPLECAACGAHVLYEFPHQRDDGRKIRFCVACGTGSIPDHGLDLGKIYGPDYWLEAREYGYDVDPTVRHWQNNLWKVYLLHQWGLHLAGGSGRTQVVDVGAGASPARALTRADRDRLRWRDADLSGFALDFVEHAYGKCEEPFKDPDHLLMGFFEVLEHVDDPVGFLKENLDSVRQAGFAVIYVPHASPEQAWEAGADWIQLHNSLEHLQFFGKHGLAAVLNRVGLGAAILTSPVGLLAIADLSRKSDEIVHFDDWKLFAIHCGVPEHAMAVYACLNDIVPFSALEEYVATDPFLERIITAGGGQTTPFEGEYGAQFNYARIASEFSFAAIVENIQQGEYKPKEFLPPKVRKARSYREMPLFNSTGGPLNVLYVGMKWDYGVPEQGWSFEHQNLYPALFYSPCVKSFLHYDYVEIARRHGVAEMSRGLIEIAQRYKPDLVFTVFYYDDFDPNNDALLRLSDIEWCGATVVGFFFDDIYRFETHTRLRTDVINASVTTLPRSNHNPYVEYGYSDKVIYSSAGANPLYYHKRPEAKSKYDVSLIGLPHSNRRIIVDRLKEAGIDVATFGKGWSPTSRISFSEMLDVLHSSKIVLNPSQAAHGAPGQVKGRTFEVPACGKLLLTGPMDGLSNLYSASEEMPVYYDYDDLIEKIRLFLADDKLREEVAENAWRRTLREHTWEHRIQQIFRTVAPRRQFPDPPQYGVAP